MTTSSLRNTAAMLGVLVLALILAAPPAIAGERDDDDDDDRGAVILGVFVDFSFEDGIPIFITGSGFLPNDWSSDPVVTLGGMSLPVIDASDTEIVVDCFDFRGLPGHRKTFCPDGDYLLVVTPASGDDDDDDDDADDDDDDRDDNDKDKDRSSVSATYALTIGAVGPQGETGAAGLDGLEGARGDDGKPGATGLRGPRGFKGDQGIAGTDGALAGLTCATDQVAKWDGSAWVCADVSVTATGPKTVFVTSGSFTGDLRTEGGALTGLRGGDEICQAAAEQGVVPPGTYIAWLSTAFKDARDRLPPNTDGYFLPNGTKVADDKADLLSCPGGRCLANPIGVDEFGDTRPGGLVWTGTFFDGIGAGDDCDGWTAGVGILRLGSTGDSGAVGPLWMGDFGGLAGSGCSSRLPLYCFQR